MTIEPLPFASVASVAPVALVWPSRLRRLARSLPAGLACAAGWCAFLRLGQDLTDPATQVIPVFPAAGFAVAILLKFGWRRFLGWLVLGLLADMCIRGAVSRFWLVAAGNAAAMLTATLLSERFADGVRFLERPRSVFMFVLVGAGGFGLCSAVVGMTVLVWIGFLPWNLVGREGFIWAVADVVGILLVTPPLLAWSKNWRLPRLSALRKTEMVALLLVGLGVTQLAFSGWPFPPHQYSLEYLAIPVLMWGAFRFPQRGATTMTLVVGAVAIVNTLVGRGPFALHYHAGLILLQMYLGAVSLLVLVLAAGVRERETQALALQRALDEAQKAGAEAEKARGKAERADRAKSAFLSRMSHELRTPLNAILGFSQLLQLQGDKDEMVDDCSQHILEAGRHLLTLVDEVLDLATLNRGHMVLSPEPVAMAALVGDCLTQLEELARAQGVTCRLEEPAGTANPAACVILADRKRLHQVMCHLLSNAIQYNAAGGQVSVSFARIGGTVEGSPEGWRICVADTGRGISLEDQEQLFTPFQRLGAERTDQEGTGLGLVVSRSLVEAMAGRLGLESSPGRGSTFWVELPAAGESPLETVLPIPAQTPGRRTTPAAPPAAAVAGLDWKVLYVEDNASNLHLVRTAFALHFPRLHLLSTASGREGLRLAQEHRPGLILLDVQLPDLDGDVVLARLRANRATQDVPVVILSADATSVSRLRLLGAGALEYLTKPLMVTELLTLVNRVFRGGAGPAG